MLEQLGKQAKSAARELSFFDEEKKNQCLQAVADALVREVPQILVANERDVLAAKQAGISGALLDRLTLTKQRIIQAAEGLRIIIALPEPIGKILAMEKRPNGLLIGKKVVPLGVVGIIYEARPNVTVDAFGLCFKSSNAILLRGGKEAIYSNTVLVQIMRQALNDKGVNPDVIQLVEDTSRASATAMMKLHHYIDVLIPRGGAGLIKTVIEQATVPVIETGTGNCHVYIDKEADLSKAIEIAYNAKVRRPGVCNACETILVHTAIKDIFLKQLASRFKGVVEIRGDVATCQLILEAIPATNKDYATEYLDYIVAIKVVENVSEAIAHIETYTTRHSEAIVTENKITAERFLNEVDAAAVYVNASTAFTDGGEFGMGAEMGISTQKLHARGPIGLKELTTIKYVIYGDGQVRPQ